MNETIPRLSVNLSQEQAVALQEIFPFGLKKPFFQLFVDWLIYNHDRNGKSFLTDFYINQGKFDDEFLPYLSRRRKLGDPVKDMIDELVQLLGFVPEADYLITLRKVIRMIKANKEAADGNGLR